MEVEPHRQNDCAQVLHPDIIMPAIAKAQGKQTLQHVLTNILEDKEDNGTQGHITLSLMKNGVTGILDLNTISVDDIDALRDLILPKSCQI
jgi:hypothetical protein